MADNNLEDLDAPTSIDPYAILGIPNTATDAEVRSAYRKLALKLHPDKAAPAERDNAHKAFQDLAFAYAILSDERRRKRYDITGNTSESLDLDDDFNWSDFFRTQYSELVTAEKIAEFERTYKRSDEERKDVLEAYRKGKGSLDKIFEHVVLSNPLDDEGRFRSYIDEAIKGGEVKALKAYTDESEKCRQRRQKGALKEKEEAEAHTKDLGVSENKTRKGGKKSKGKTEDITDLALLIQQRNEQRRGNFLDGLLEKYGGNSRTKGTKRGSAAVLDEPGEEAFAEMASRKKSRIAEEEVGEDADEEKESSTRKPKSSRNRAAKKGRA